MGNLLKIFVRSLRAGLLFTAFGVLSASAATVNDSAVERIEAEDFSQIQWGRDFQVLVPSDAFVPPLTPNEREAHRYERQLIEKFARKYHLVPIFVPVDRREDLIPALLSGEGHVIAAHLKVTDRRKQQVAFTSPFHTVREQLVVRAGDEIRSEGDLKGREIVVRERSSFWDVVQEARKRIPDIEIRLVPENTSDEDLLIGVLEGRHDMAAADVSALNQNPTRWTALSVVADLFQDDAISWGIHPDAPELLDALNRFLRKEHLARRQQYLYLADFPEIKKRKLLRVLTRNNATTYFVWRGKLMGFEYDLLKKFVDEHRIQLEMVVPPSRDELIPGLLRGKGDVIAASLTISDQRRALGIEFTRPYNLVSEVLVARKDDSISHVSQLSGRTLWVRRSSSYWHTVEQLRAKSGISFDVEPAPEDMETEEIIAMVARGEYDLTISDSHILDVALTWREDVRAAFDVKHGVEHGWAVRQQDQELLRALNEFLEKEYKQLHYNIVYKKYFKNPRRIKSLVKHRADVINGGQLSPYDDIVRRYAEEYGFDWPLIIAVMYRESRFDKNARSWAGARGVMQVLPVTAKRFGVEDLENPEKGIYAGIRMLSWIYSRFEPELPVRERIWLSLAAYNAGLGHVFDARVLAAEKGLDPNQWFDNVEKAMLMLSKPKYYRKATYGYVRGIEPVTYVRDIRQLYDAYSQLIIEN